MSAGADPAKPDFVVLGAMKCATSTVCKYLEEHPEVYMAPRCEPNYFSDDANYAKGPEWYARFFAPRQGEAICGEGSNDYAAGAMYPHSAERMARDLPEARLIFMVRHPLRRIVSAWVQNRVDMGDAVPPTLEAAVREMPARFVDQSLYWKNLSRYRALYPDAQIFIGFMEDLSRDSDAFFGRLCAFLGVEPYSVDAGLHVNPSAGKRVPAGLYTRLNSAGPVRLAKQVLPKGVTRAVKDRLLSRPAAEMRLPPEIEAELAEELRPDAQALLAHCGKPGDFWAL
ncbi:hypothetical protein Ga0609869_003606 [Rhodovulum iodosum]|uniref:Sulfotransferase domain-containing protein n=1 Tax=Rhodovulum iodosum TaxID=68291 RepID=A0ABV3XYX9_9RHOB|nr:sulfotransferase [Rhodovulum robiginosum]RSK38892.1 hypothetical protein EJA01_01720 [Rhodovulum robiginosum]